MYNRNNTRILLLCDARKINVILLGGSFMKIRVTKVLRGCTVLTLISMLALSSLPSSAKLAGYEDVPSNAWYGSNLESMSSLGIINGYGDGNFGPKDNLTKAQYITMLVRLLKEEPGAKGQKWWDAYVNKAVELGIMKERDAADMEEDISRQQMALYTERVLTLRGEDLRPDTGLESQILDWDDIIINKDQVLKCYAAGILTGYPDGSFKGQNKLKRAEALVVLDRILRKEARKPAEVSDMQEIYKEAVKNNMATDNVEWKDGEAIISSLYTKDNRTYLPPGSISKEKLSNIHKLIERIQEYYLTNSKYYIGTEHQKNNDKPLRSSVSISIALSEQGYINGVDYGYYQIFDRDYLPTTSNDKLSDRVDMLIVANYNNKEHAFEAVRGLMKVDVIEYLNNMMEKAWLSKLEDRKIYTKYFDGIRIDLFSNVGGLYIYLSFNEGE